MVVGETKLHFFYLDHESNYWERLSAGDDLKLFRKREKLFLLPDFQLTVGSNHHLSVFGPRFCVADDEGFIRVSSRQHCRHESSFNQGVGDLLRGFERPHLRGLSSSPKAFLGSVDALERQGSLYNQFPLYWLTVSGDRPSDQRRDPCLLPSLSKRPAHV